MKIGDHLMHTTRLPPKKNGRLRRRLANAIGNRSSGYGLDALVERLPSRKTRVTGPEIVDRLMVLFKEHSVTPEHDMPRVITSLIGNKPVRREALAHYDETYAKAA